MITIKTNLIAAIAKWAIADVRYDRVMFRAGRILATDGWRIVEVPHETEGHTWAVPAHALLAAAAAQRVLIANEDCDEDCAELLRITDEGVPDSFTIGFRYTRGVLAERREFPHELHAKIVGTFDAAKTGKPADGIVLNPRYLADVGEVLEATAEGNAGVRIVGWSGYASPTSTGPIIMTSPTGARFAIMPMKDWMKDWP